MSRAKFAAYPYVCGSNVIKGMTIREVYALNAPAEPQEWFKPTIPTPCPIVPNWHAIPDKKTRDDVSRAIDCGTDAETTEGAAWLEHQAETQKALEKWDAEYSRARCVQWPGAWADAVLADLERSAS